MHALVSYLCACQESMKKYLFFLLPFYGTVDMVIILSLLFILIPWRYVYE